MDEVEVLILVFSAGTFVVALLTFFGGWAYLRDRWVSSRVRTDYSLSIASELTTGLYLPEYVGLVDVNIKIASTRVVRTSRIHITVPELVSSIDAKARTEELIVHGPRNPTNARPGLHVFDLYPPAYFDSAREAIVTLYLRADPELASYDANFSFASRPPCHTVYPIHFDFSGEGVDKAREYQAKLAAQR